MNTLCSRLITVVACFFIFSAAWFCLWSISLHLVERPELAVLLFPFGLRLGLMLQCPRGYWPVLLGALGFLALRALDARLPRTLAGLLAGVALGLAGALMQTLTRNPLADPGILGVNSGASFAIVLGAALFGFTSPSEQLMMAFCGALAASLVVAFTGSQGGGQRFGFFAAVDGSVLGGGVHIRLRDR